MTDEIRLQLRPKSGVSSLSPSKMRSGLIARGRQDAAMLIVPERTESEWEEACRLAEQGDACAQSQLGLEYLYGPGFLGGHDEDAGQDWAEGERWLRKAAHQGFAKAQYHLGYLYDQGRGLPSNDAEAVRWYQKAADQGHYEAEISLENRRLRRMT